MPITWYWQKRAASYMSNKTPSYARLRQYFHVSGYFMTTIFKLFFFICIFSSCDKTYKIYSDSITSSEAIKDGFHLSQIAVAYFENDGRPSKYSTTLTIFCGPNSMLSGFSADSVYNHTEKQLRAKAWKTMDSIMKMNGNRIGGEGHENGIDLYFSGERTRDSIERIHFPFVAQKTVYFDKANECYKWVFCMKQGDLENAFDYSKGLFDKIPIQFKTDQWYMLDFSNASNIIDKVFFYIDKNHKIHQHNYYRVLMGV